MDADVLLQRYADSGEERAFMEFVHVCSGMVYGIARRRLGKTTAAEEVAQNVFTLVARKSKRLARQRGVRATRNSKLPTT